MFNDKKTGLKSGNQTGSNSPAFLLDQEKKKKLAEEERRKKIADEERARKLADEAKKAKRLADEEKRKAMLLAADIESKKRAEQAKKNIEARLAEQTRQEKIRIQIQIDNYHRELARLAVEIKSKEVQLAEAKRKAEEAKKSEFILKGQIKQKEGGLDYLAKDIVSEENRMTASGRGLEAVRTNLENTRMDILNLESRATSLPAEPAEIEGQLDHKEFLLKKINQEYKSRESGHQQIIGEKSRVMKTASAKKREIVDKSRELIFIKRQAEDFEREQKIFTTILDRLNREKMAKERRQETSN